MDDLAFGVDFGRFEKKVVGPVMKDEQARVLSTGTGGRNIGDVVDCLFHAGGGVEIRAEFHADGFEIVDQVFSGEMCGAVEAHVFKEVGQTALVVLFEDGSHFLGDVEIGLTFGIFVVTDVIGQPVGEFPDAGLRIESHSRHLLGHCGGRKQHESDHHE